MQEKGCGIVRDLLPSYQEGLVSENTGYMIRQHLAGCAGCRVYRDNLGKQAEIEREQDQRKGIAFSQKLMGYKYQFMGFGIGLLLPLGAIAALGLIGVINSFFQSMVFSYFLY